MVALLFARKRRGRGIKRGSILADDVLRLGNITNSPGLSPHPHPTDTRPPPNKFYFRPQVVRDPGCGAGGDAGAGGSIFSAR